MVRLEMGEREDDPAQEEFQDYQVENNIIIIRRIVRPAITNISIDNPFMLKYSNKKLQILVLTS